MRDLLREALDEATLGTPVYDVLDFWHVLEKLAPAAQMIYSEARGSEILSTWRRNLLHRRAAIDDIIVALTASGKRMVRVNTTRPVHEAITCVENHREMDYPGARQRGLPTGSGNTEATCKTLFTVRIKRSGARWNEATAADVINLRALALSDRWEPALQLTLAPLRTAVRVAA